MIKYSFGNIIGNFLQTKLLWEKFIYINGMIDWFGARVNAIIKTFFVWLLKINAYAKQIFQINLTWWEKKLEVENLTEIVYKLSKSAKNNPENLHI